MTHVLEGDARTLLEEYDGGGSPSTGEPLLAEGLARAQWSGSAFRASLRDVPESVRAGRLIDVLDPAAAVLESADISGVRPALHGFLRHDMDRSGGSGPGSSVTTTLAAAWSKPAGQRVSAVTLFA
ncbi:hypothetical protein ACFWD7_56170 [Streptomyces mirabilis]|uniref:hypothetical protein n=1 Tax=Streptomyces mirabilis TaxID=68239 RepID=UPI0036BE461B